MEISSHLTWNKVKKDLNSQVTLSSETMKPKPYVSCIKICGKPIHPPIMTPQRRKEMLELKRLAILKEKKLSQRRTQQTISRLKEILAKLESDKVNRNDVNYSKPDENFNHTESDILTQDLRTNIEILDENHPCNADLMSFQENVDTETTLTSTESEYCNDQVSTVQTSNIEGVHLMDDNFQHEENCVFTLHSAQCTHTDLDIVRPGVENVVNKQNSLTNDKLGHQISASNDKKLLILTQPICHSTAMREVNGNIQNFSTPPISQHMFLPSSDVSDESFQVEGDVNVKDSSSMTMEVSTFFTSSTDIQSYMKVSDDSFSNSDVNVLVRRDFSSQTPELDRNGPFFFNEAQEITTFDLNSISSNSSTVESSPTVCEAVPTDNANERPKLVRRGSYTLETPSPALLSSGRQIEISESDSVSVENLRNTNDVVNSFKDTEINLPGENNKNSEDFNSQSKSIDSVGCVTKSPRKDVLDAQADEMFIQKQQHLQRYLTQLSLSNRHGNEVTLFPSINQTDFFRKESPCCESKNYLFPKVQVSPLENESAIDSCASKAMILANDTLCTRLPEQDIHSGYQDSLNSISCRSNLSVQESLSDHEKHFKNSYETLQKQHKLQMDALMKDQWNEQLSLREQFLHQQEKVMNQICSVDNSSVEKNIEEIFQVKPQVLPSTQNLISYTTNKQAPIKMYSEALVPERKKTFEKLPAFVKGHLTRKLMKADQVQNQIQTIKDTLKFALKFQCETPIKNNQVSVQDVNLHRRLISQVTDACHQLHNIFFGLSKSEQMKIIVKSEIMKNKSEFRSYSPDGKRKLSAATIKYRARKQEYDLKTSVKPNLYTSNRKNQNSIRSYHSEPQKNILQKSSESVRRRLYGTVNKENTRPSQTYVIKNTLGIRRHWK